MAKSVDANDLFLKCMAGSVPERLTATTVATYITSPFAIHCKKFVSEDEKNKRRLEMNEIFPWPDTTDQEKTISEYISKSIMEGKDLEIMHDRLVQLSEKL